MKTDLERFKELFDSVGLNYFECGGIKVDGTVVFREINIEDSEGEFRCFTFTPEGKFKEFEGIIE